MPGEKRRLTQRQLENLAKGNPRVAEGLKSGRYKDRLLGDTGPGVGAVRRKPRAKPAELPKNKPTRKPAAKPAARKEQRAARGSNAEQPKQRGGFFRGFLGGG